MVSSPKKLTIWYTARPLETGVVVEEIAVKSIGKKRVTFGTKYFHLGGSCCSVKVFQRYCATTPREAVQKALQIEKAEFSNAEEYLKKTQLKCQNLEKSLQDGAATIIKVPEWVLHPDVVGVPNIILLD